MDIYEVGPRDGLQSAAVKLSTEEKVQMIGLLHDAGLNKIEVGSFVHPQRVPNMADSEDVFREVSGLDCELECWYPTSVGLIEPSPLVPRSLISFCLLLKHLTKITWVQTSKLFFLTTEVCCMGYRKKISEFTCLMPLVAR